MRRNILCLQLALFLWLFTITCFYSCILFQRHVFLTQLKEEIQVIVVKIAYNIAKLLILYFYNSKTNNKENNDKLNSVVRR